jgi:hypothetical protein
VAYVRELRLHSRQVERKALQSMHRDFERLHRPDRRGRHGANRPLPASPSLTTAFRSDGPGPWPGVDSYRSARHYRHGGVPEGDRQIDLLVGFGHSKLDAGQQISAHGQKRIDKPSRLQRRLWADQLHVWSGNGHLVAGSSHQKRSRDKGRLGRVGAQVESVCDKGNSHPG